MAATEVFSTDHHNYEVNRLFWTDNDGDAYALAEDYETTFKDIARTPPHAHLMLIADEEFIKGFVNPFGRRHLNVHLRGEKIPRNTALVINCETGEMKHVCAGQPTLQPSR